MSARDELVRWVQHYAPELAAEPIGFMADLAIAEARAARDAEWLAALDDEIQRSIRYGLSGGYVLGRLRDRMTGGER